MTQPLGIYVSIPFCRSKCTFCNFASGAFPPARMEAYVDCLVQDITAAPSWAAAHNLVLPPAADTVFLGGGTPSLLSPGQMQRLFTALRTTFHISPNAEITVEAAPGQLADTLLDTLLANAVTRISLGVQSFVDAESRAVGRLHTAAQCLAEIDRLRAAGVPRLSVDLIAGLPLQTEASWQTSLNTLIESGVEHASIYMLEVDGDSSLGTAVTQNREQLRATSQLAVLGQHASRYNAQSVPDDDRIATLYTTACSTLEAAGLPHYEISNFGTPSRHNLKYWQRAPYLGFGVDAHSMLLAENGQPVRFARTDELDPYLANTQTPQLDRITPLEAFEETIFLGLRLTAGIPLADLRAHHAPVLVANLLHRAAPLTTAGVLTLADDTLRLTPRGRAISSTVFGQLLA